jgi:hypothetical protein
VANLYYIYVGHCVCNGALRYFVWNLVVKLYVCGTSLVARPLRCLAQSVFVGSRAFKWNITLVAKRLTYVEYCLLVGMV